jgi:hypothetical protein
MVLSADPDAILFYLRFNKTSTESMCPVRDIFMCKVWAFQTLIVLSHDPLTKVDFGRKINVRTVNW